MIEFLSGALTFAYIIAGVFFLRFWRKTGDLLFLSFCVAFWLFALNQLIVSALGAADERTGFAYLLRVLGFTVILIAIVGKNLAPRRQRRPSNVGSGWTSPPRSDT
jgi:hypothetical protein